ncbi:MAG: deoxyribonuclease IV [Candidatus Paceibacterota bacterium]
MSKEKTTLNIGAHQSAAGGYAKAVQRAADIGATSLQLFSSSPRSWAGANISKEDVEEFRQMKDELGIDPVVFHAPYLINLADRGGTGEKSIKAMIEELNVAARCGIIGSVVHVGSWKTDDESPEDEDHFEHLVTSLKTVLEETDSAADFLIENMGTRKIGKGFEEIGRIIDACDGDERLKVCLDTCHLHVAGFDLADGYDDFFQRFDKLIGLERLSVIHVNDSRDDFGSLRDRHANLGEGEIPEGVFRNLTTKSPTKDLPLILETPGFEGKGPDAKNVKILRDSAL